MTTTRVVNLNREAFDVRIDRCSASLGNPFRIGPDGNRATVIEKHMAQWRGYLAQPAVYPGALAMLREMKGKRLGCHCKPKACHGDNYVQLIAEFCPDEFRVLVCGGRTFFDAARVFAVLDHYHAQRPFSLVVHGNAPGADLAADAWARSRGVNVARYPAAWDIHGHRAGPIRNADMLAKEFPQVVIAFPGGKGTRNMKAQATEALGPDRVLEIPA